MPPNACPGFFLPIGQNFQFIMNASNTLLNLETLRPRLVAGVTFIDAGPVHVFLKNLTKVTYVKLTKEEATLVQTFDGTRGLPDILQAQIEKTGTRYFQRTLDAIEKLNSGSFLADGPASDQSPSPDKIYQPSGFNNRALQFFATALTSLPGLVLLALCGVTGQLLATFSHGKKFFLAFSVLPTAGEMERVLAYGGGLIILWLTLVLVISMKNLLSAGALAYYQCEVLRPRLRFSYGLIFFDCELDDIVMAGRTRIFRLFAMRILFPLLFMPVAVALSFLWTFPEIVRQVCWFTFLFGVAPLFESELTKYMYYTTEFGSTGQPINRFLREKFLRGLFGQNGEVRVQNYLLGMSAAALLWLYGIYAALWGILLAGFTDLVVDFKVGGMLIKTLTSIYFIILTLPLVVVLAVFISIGISNAVSVTGSPLRRLTQLGRKIARGRVPAQGELAEFLRGIPLFSKLDSNEIDVLASRLRIVRLRPGTTAVAQGDPADAFYCVVSGKLRVTIEDEYCQERVVNELTPGGSFGEIALLESSPRTATVTAVEPSTLIELGRKEFENFVIRSAGGGEKVTDMINIGRMLMEGNSVFALLTPCQINRLVVLLKRENYRVGETIFHEGEPGDRFYIVNKGKVFVDLTETGSPVRRLTLGRGDFFGEIALIKRILRTATVTAAGDVEVLYLTKDEFYDFLGHNAWAGVRFDEVATRRMANV
ncbi:membrane hypothetical protein [Gammaproteobacteria bacterium]